MRYFEDFRVGETDALGSHTITEAEIVAFAEKYDPQPFHIDPEAAKATIFGGLIASGWHTCAILMRLTVEAAQREQAAAAGSPGIDSCRWLKAVRPGDTLTDGRVRVYGDNVAVARWLQKTIETLLFPAFADSALPVVAAGFERRGGPWSTATETVSAADARITLSWYDCIEPFVLHAPPGFNDRPIGVFSTFFPARGAQLELNGRVAAGSPWPEMRGDRQGSSATLAWSETWVKPRG